MLKKNQWMKFDIIQKSLEERDINLSSHWRLVLDAIHSIRCNYHYKLILFGIYVFHVNFDHDHRSSTADWIIKLFFPSTTAKVAEIVRRIFGWLFLSSFKSKWMESNEPEDSIQSFDSFLFQFSWQNKTQNGLEKVSMEWKFDLFLGS